MENPLEVFTKLITDTGGYVNPSLLLLVGDDALHGEVSLAGVPDDELALRVPLSLQETPNKEGAWTEFCRSLGQEIDAKWWATREPVMPLLAAVNHNDSSKGRMTYALDFVELYGSETCYTKKPLRLKKIWGIES